jgi:hypothetical protein
MVAHAQPSLKNVFPGNWQFCESDFGYSEIHVKDSVFEYNSEFNPSGMSFRYKIIDDLVFYGYETWSDTFKIEVINKDSIHVYHYRTKKDSYYNKMDDPIITGFDYDCNLKVDFYEFNDLLEDKFNVRKLKYSDICNFTDELELEEDSIKVDWLEIPDTFDEELSISYQERGYLYEGLQYERLTEVNTIEPTKLIDFISKYDTLDITIETTSECYYTYTDYIIQTKASTIDLIFDTNTGRCNDLCRFKLKYRIVIDLKKYSTFLFNGKKLK